MGDEVYSLGFVEAKYIKMVFNGNNNDDKTTIGKVEFYHNNYEPQTTQSFPLLPVILGSVGGAIAVIGVVVAVVIIVKKRRKTNEEIITDDSSSSN